MHPRTMQTLGGILSGTGLFLILAFAGFLLIQWSTGALTPGGLGIGVFLILLIFSPLVGLGLYLWRRGRWRRRRRRSRRSSVGCWA
jgi:membrane protein implicated in regulation of membrane protease activity